jgi:hypothetical protein
VSKLYKTTTFPSRDLHRHQLSKLAKYLAEILVSSIWIKSTNKNLADKNRINHQQHHTVKPVAFERNIVQLVLTVELFGSLSVFEPCAGPPAQFVRVLGKRHPCKCSISLA